MLLPALDTRLKAAYELVGTCERYADIGADHGLLPLHLVAHQKVLHAIVADISAPALEKAKATFQLHGLMDKADFIAADGLGAIGAPQDVVSILGMGGETLMGILRGGRESLKDAALVLSPHTGLYDVRRGISQMGYEIVAERLVRARGRFYVIMRAQRGAAPYSEKQLWLGPCLMRNPPPVYQGYLLWRHKVARIARSEELAYVEEALQCL